MILYGAYYHPSHEKLADLVIEMTGFSLMLVTLPPLPDGDMRRSCSDNSKLSKNTGT